jgi:hypothetical protein
MISIGLVSLAEAYSGIFLRAIRFREFLYSQTKGAYLTLEPWGMFLSVAGPTGAGRGNGLARRRLAANIAPSNDILLVGVAQDSGNGTSRGSSGRDEKGGNRRQEKKGFSSIVQ